MKRSMHRPYIWQYDITLILLKGVWRTYPVPFDSKLKKKKKYKKLKEKKFEPVLEMKHTNTQTWEHFNRLCAGEKMMKPETEKDLKCQFLHHDDFYLKLGPFKLDVQFLNPFVGVFRNILYDDEMNHYQEYARHNLQKCQFGGLSAVTRDCR